MSLRTHNIAAWLWNQYVITLASFTAFVGFTFVNPFLSLFLSRELHLTDMRDVALWSGVLFAAAPLLSAFSGPVWSSLADRFGYKRMVQRASFSFVIILGIMAFVPDVWQLFILRIALGLLDGFAGMSMALIGGAVSPLVFDALAGLNLRYVFGADAIVYALTFAWVWVVVWSVGRMKRET